MGHHSRWSLASVRAAHLLDPERGGLHERYRHGRAGDRLFDPRADDARHEPRQYDGQEYGPAGLDLPALVLASALTDHRARILWLSHRPLPCRLSARADRRHMGAVLFG